MSGRRWRLGGGGLVGGDVRGAAAVAGGRLGPLDVEVEQLHLSGRRDTGDTGVGLEEESPQLALPQAPATFSSQPLVFRALSCRSAHPTDIFTVTSLVFSKRARVTLFD